MRILLVIMHCHSEYLTFHIPVVHHGRVAVSVERKGIGVKVADLR